MEFIRKYIYIIYFVCLFVTLPIWDYFRKGDWNLINNFFYSIWVVIVFAFFNSLFSSEKHKKKIN